LNQTAKGLPERIGEGEDQYELRAGVLKDLERIKWYLWHGNVFQALNELQSLEMDLDAAVFENKNEIAQKLGVLQRTAKLRVRTSDTPRKEPGRQVSRFL